MTTTYRPERGLTRPAVSSRPARRSDDKHPLFCLQYLTKKFDLQALEKPAVVAFAKALHKRAQMPWEEIRKSERHKLGYEMLPKKEFKAAVPSVFSDEVEFMVFRYKGLLPMAGVRKGRVFHVLWIEPSFGKLYDH